jgi:hypothetical protein
MSELDKIAGNIARDLDAGDKDAAATVLSQQYGSLQKEDFITLLKGVDSKEQDSIGYDLTLKIGANNVAEHFALLPGNENASAKLMASLMDEGKGIDAKALMDRVVGAIEQRNVMETLGRNGDYRLWLKAVDTYEKDGIGHDVTIDLNNLDIKTGVIWTVNTTPEVAPKQLGMSEESLDIPALTLEKAAGKDNSVS